MFARPAPSTTDRLEPQVSTIADCTPTVPVRDTKDSAVKTVDDVFVSFRNPSAVSFPTVHQYQMGLATQKGDSIDQTARRVTFSPTCIQNVDGSTRRTAAGVSFEVWRSITSGGTMDAAEAVGG